MNIITIEDNIKLNQLLGIASCIIGKYIELAKTDNKQLIAQIKSLIRLEDDIEGDLNLTEDKVTNLKKYIATFYNIDNINPFSLIDAKKEEFGPIRIYNGLTYNQNQEQVPYEDDYVSEDGIVYYYSYSTSSKDAMEGFYDESLTNMLTIEFLKELETYLQRKRKGRYYDKANLLKYILISTNKTVENYYYALGTSNLFYPRLETIIDINANDIYSCLSKYACEILINLMSKLNETNDPYRLFILEMLIKVVNSHITNGREEVVKAINDMKETVKADKRKVKILNKLIAAK